MPPASPEAASPVARPRVLVTHPYLAQVLPLDPAQYRIEVLAAQPDPAAWLAAEGAGLRAVVTSGMEPIDAAWLDLVPDLELIAVPAAGLAAIDLEAAAARGIAVTNAAGLNAADVADFAFALFLARRRDLFAADAWVRAGKWAEARMPVSGSIAAERVGIVGLGHIGRATAARLAPFGCAVRWWGRRSQPDEALPFEPDLVALADWATTLIVCVAGTEGTRGLVTRAVLEALGPEGLLVNVARGFVVDEPALKDLLRSGGLGAAALDVVEHEPDDGTSWADVPNTILAPHVAGATRESFIDLMGGAADNVRRLFAGEPLLRRVV